MNDLIKVEENQLIIAKKMVEQIKKIENQKKLIDSNEKKLKEELKTIMKDNGILSYESSDKTLKISRSCDTSSISFDAEAFKKDYPDLFKKYYTKETSKAGALRITVREEKEDDDVRKTF